MTHEWIVIGGGIHGCTVATHLIKSNKTSSEQLLLIDPHPSPLFEWKKKTSFIDMPYLRSPGVHHLDVDPFSLQSFKKEQSYATGFYGIYKRPSLEMFNDHCDQLFEDVNITKCWKQGKVTHVEKSGDLWKVEVDHSQTFFGKNVVVATGTNHKLSYPEWGQELRSIDPHHVAHIFEEKLPTLKPPFVVIGGGITAAHLVIRLAREFPGQVTQITRHDTRVHDFDSDPGWLGPKYMNAFEKIREYQTRRKIITKVRNKGSVTSELGAKLVRLKRENKLEIIKDEVSTCQKGKEGFDLSLLSSNLPIQAATILFATGFSKEVMKVDWLQNLIQTHQLKCAECGFPIVNQSLSWCDHLFVTGPLAELEIGPTARNISGANKAATRIAAR